MSGVMFSTSEFWVLIAFILLVAGTGKHVYVYITQFVDAYRQQIAFQLQEATRLHEEALSLLETYKTKYESAAAQAEETLAFVDKEVKEFRKSTEQAYEEFKAQKETMLLEHLAIEKQEILGKLCTEAVQEALQIVECVLESDEAMRRKLTKESIGDIMTHSIHLKKNL